VRSGGEGPSSEDSSIEALLVLAAIISFPSLILLHIFAVILTLARHRLDRSFLAVAAVAFGLTTGAPVPYETGLHLFVDTEGLAETSGVELKQHKSVS
jgi:hypothetical protein